MSETAKHTAGGWAKKVDDIGEVRVFAADGGCIAIMAGNINDGANARLIAAAPELLDALERLVHWHDQIGAADLAQARAAIKKATQPA